MVPKMPEARLRLEDQKEVSINNIHIKLVGRNSVMFD
jgi:hypothetical protein